MTKKITYTIITAVFVGIISNPIFGFAADEFNSQEISQKLDTAKTALLDVQDMIATGSVLGERDESEKDIEAIMDVVDEVDRRSELLSLKLQLQQLVANLSSKPINLSSLKAGARKLQKLGTDVGEMVQDLPDMSSEEAVAPRNIANTSKELFNNLNQPDSENVVNKIQENISTIRKDAKSLKGELEERLEGSASGPKLTFSNHVIDSGEYLQYNMELGIDESEFGHYEIELKCEPGIDASMKVYGNGCEEPVELDSFQEGEFTNSSKFTNNIDERKEVGVVLTVYDESGDKIAASGDVSAVTVRPEDEQESDITADVVGRNASSESERAANTKGVYTIKYQVTAEGADQLWMTQDYNLIDENDTEIDPGDYSDKSNQSISCNTKSEAERWKGGSYIVREGETKEFTLTCEVTTSEDRFLGLRLNQIKYDEQGDSNASHTLQLTQESDWETDLIEIDASDSNVSADPNIQFPEDTRIESGTQVDYVLEPNVTPKDKMGYLTFDVKCEPGVQADVKMGSCDAEVRIDGQSRPIRLSTTFTNTAETTKEAGVTMKVFDQTGDRIGMAGNVRLFKIQPEESKANKIKINQPKQGDDFEVGETMNIRLDKHSAQSDSPVTVKLQLAEGASSDEIMTTKQESISWKISATNRLIETLRGLARVADKYSYYSGSSDYENEFRITVHDADSGEKLAESGQFEITVPGVN